jgi:hypothetical protein
MSCLSATRRTALIARRDKLIAQIAAAETTLDNAIERGHLTSIEMDSGDGKEKSSYRNPEDLRKFINNLELSLERVLNTLACRGVVNFALRR